MQKQAVYVLKIVVETNHATPHQWSVLFVEQHCFDKVRKNMLGKCCQNMLCIYTHATEEAGNVTLPDLQGSC